MCLLGFCREGCFFRGESVGDSRVDGGSLLFEETLSWLKSLSGCGLSPFFPLGGSSGSVLIFSFAD